MDSKRIHFPQTIAQQRKLLFETWEVTGNVTEACRKARFDEGEAKTNKEVWISWRSISPLLA
jgi:hypothetical protein